MQKEIKSSKLATFFACPVSDVDALMFGFGVIRYLCLEIRFVKLEVLLLSGLYNLMSNSLLRFQCSKHIGGQLLFHLPTVIKSCFFAFSTF